MSVVRVIVTNDEKTVIDETAPVEHDTVRFVENQFGVTVEPGGFEATIGVRFEFDPPLVRPLAKELE